MKDLSRLTVGRTVLAKVAFFNFQDTPLDHFLDPRQVEDHATRGVFKKAWQALSQTNLDVFNSEFGHPIAVLHEFAIIPMEVR